MWTSLIVTPGAAPGLWRVEARDAERATVHRAAPPWRMTRNDLPGISAKVQKPAQSS